MTIDEYNKSKRKESNNKYIKNFISRFMISTIILLSLLIASSKNNKIHKFIKENIFYEQFDFSTINKLYNEYVLNPFNKAKEDMMVFNSINEEEMIDYYGGVKINKKSDKSIKVIESGIVVYIGEKENFGNTIVIQQSNGIDCWYGNLSNINVNMYSYVTKGTILGEVNDYVYLYFEKDKERIDYKEIIK